MSACKYSIAAPAGVVVILNTETGRKHTVVDQARGLVLYESLWAVWTLADNGLTTRERAGEVNDRLIMALLFNEPQALDLVTLAIADTLTDGGRSVVLVAASRVSPAFHRVSLLADVLWVNLGHLWGYRGMPAGRKGRGWRFGMDGKRVKLKSRALGCLHEALRRYTRFHAGKDITAPNCWVGLGFRGEYKQAIEAGLMQFAHHYEPRCMGWLVLTDRGAEYVTHWLKQGYTHLDIEGSTRGCPPDPEFLVN